MVSEIMPKRAMNDVATSTQTTAATPVTASGSGTKYSDWASASAGTQRRRNHVRYEPSPEIVITPPMESTHVATSSAPIAPTSSATTPNARAAAGQKASDSMAVTMYALLHMKRMTASQHATQQPQQPSMALAQQFWLPCSSSLACSTCLMARDRRTYATLKRASRQAPNARVPKWKMTPTRKPRSIGNHVMRFFLMPAMLTYSLKNQSCAA
mmetsp:Transcript_5213/g.14178  ORF Transcript_5213/g.14178 Transcript_5213/m.14178 type:complete len:212 (-) Transcript_5213:518-1153(-)